MNIDWQFVLFASFSVTGIIQWLKGIVRDPSNLWGYISPILCFGMAYLINGTWQQIIMNTTLVLCVSQLGYDILVKPIKRILGVPDISQKAVDTSASSGASVTPDNVSSK